MSKLSIKNDETKNSLTISSLVNLELQYKLVAVLVVTGCEAKQTKAT